MAERADCRIARISAVYGVLTSLSYMLRSYPVLLTGSRIIDLPNLAQPESLTSMFPQACSSAAEESAVSTFATGLMTSTAIVLAVGSSLMLTSGTTVESYAAAIQRAQVVTNPCATARSCNPCAAGSSPCAPCEGTSPCNPCAAGATGAPTSCTVPRLVRGATADPGATAGPRSPCAVANPCRPCAGANPCNPCASGGACNPCAVGKPAACGPCNPSVAANPCDPCAVANPCAVAEKQPAPVLTEAELVAAYDCVSPYMAEAYARSSHAAAAAYRSWTRFSRTAYPTEAHGVRFMNNYANDIGDDAYGKFEGVGTMPTGSVLAKDSFIVAPDGVISVAPLFVMEKRTAGFSEAARDWFYQMIMPDGAVRADADIQSFCNGCHRRAGAVDDHLMFLPLPYRISSTSD